MSKNGLMLKAGGIATAAAAHAIFACGLIAGQPQAELYLAQLAAPAPHTLESPQWQLAARRGHGADERQLPVTQTLTPERLHKGLTTC